VASSVFDGQQRPTASSSLDHCKLQATVNALQPTSRGWERFMSPSVNVNRRRREMSRPWIMRLKNERSALIVQRRSQTLTHSPSLARHVTSPRDDRPTDRPGLSILKNDCTPVKHSRSGRTSLPSGTKFGHRKLRDCTLTYGDNSECPTRLGLIRYRDVTPGRTDQRTHRITVAGTRLAVARNIHAKLKCWLLWKCTPVGPIQISTCAHWYAAKSFNFRYICSSCDIAWRNIRYL